MHQRRISSSKNLPGIIKAELKRVSPEIKTIFVVCRYVQFGQVEMCVLPGIKSNINVTSRMLLQMPGIPILFSNSMIRTQLAMIASSIQLEQHFWEKLLNGRNSLKSNVSRIFSPAFGHVPCAMCSQSLKKTQLFL
jgi:hypothetical protein